MKKLITFAIAVFITTPVLAKKHTVEEFIQREQKVYVTDSRDNVYRFQHSCDFVISSYARIETSHRRLRENSMIKVKDNDRIEVCRVRNLEYVQR